MIYRTFLYNQINLKLAKNFAPVSCIDLIYEKTCLSTGRVEYFIETFRALGVARGHSSYKLPNRLAFIGQLRNHRARFIGG